MAEGEKKIDEEKLRYQRSVVDNMRNTVREFSRRKESKILRVPGSLSYKLAYYTKAIGALYDRVQNDKSKDAAVKKGLPVLPASKEEMKDLILETARTINGGQPLKLNSQGIPETEVEAALDNVAEKLFDRLRNPGDMAETLALTEYLLRYAKVFYPEADRRTSEAIGALFLMNQEEELPKYEDTPTWKKAANALPAVLYEKSKEEIERADEKEKKADAVAALKEMNKTVEQLRKDKVNGKEVFNNWVEAFQAQFRPKEQIRPKEQKQDKSSGEEVMFTSPWQVKTTPAVLEASTVYKESVREYDELQQLIRATGKEKDPQDVVLMRPERMALHETTGEKGCHATGYLSCCNSHFPRMSILQLLRNPLLLRADSFRLLLSHLRLCLQPIV